MQNHYPSPGQFNGAPQYASPGPQTAPYQYGTQHPVSGPTQYGHNAYQPPLQPHPQQQYTSYQVAPQPQAPYGVIQPPQNQWGQSPIASPYPTAPFPQQSPSTYTQQYGSPVGPQPYSSHSGQPISTSISSAQSWQAPVAPSPVQQLFEQEEEYEWNLLHAFKEIPSVAPHPIAHPLSDVYNEETIQPPAADAPGTIYKYVRPNNIEYFTASIRNSSHWPLVKSDPIFSEIDLDESLVPIKDLIAWVHGRQNVDYDAEEHQLSNDASPAPSGKRAWSEDTQEDADRHISQDIADHKSYDLPHQSSPVAYRGGSVTPVVAGPSTPSYGADDDAWAPQPGEGQASTTPNGPTEALLASLGVTGAPKPVTENSPSFQATQPSMPSSLSKYVFIDFIMQSY
jgi:hypothetical protein